LREDPEKIYNCPAGNYRTLMLTQLQVYRVHIDYHLAFHPDIPENKDPMAHFFSMFGSFFRQIFCTFACPDRGICRVRELPPFNIMRIYSFEDLKSLPLDPSMGSTVKNCPHIQEQQAVQFYIASDPEHLQKHKYYHGIHGLQMDEHAKHHFLEMYGPLLRDMFCGAICPLRLTCRRSGDIYFPQRYA
jgi:hypothetical protein